ACSNGGERNEILGELFGERWIAGPDLGIRGSLDAPGDEVDPDATSKDEATSTSDQPGTASTPAEKQLAKQLRQAEQAIEALQRRRSLRFATNTARLARSVSSFGPMGLLRSIRSRDLRGALVRLGLMAAAALVVAATVALILIAASQSQAFALVVGAVVVAVITASVTAIVTSSNAELLRLSEEREAMRSRLPAVELSLSQANKSVADLERKNRSLVLAAKDDSLPSLQRPVAELSQPGLRGWLARWRHR